MSRKKMNEQLLQRMNEQLESLQAFVDDWDEMYQECCETMAQICDHSPAIKALLEDYDEVKLTTLEHHQFKRYLSARSLAETSQHLADYRRGYADCLSYLLMLGVIKL